MDYMTPSSGMFDFTLELPMPPQDLQIRAFTPTEYGKAKARDKRLAIAAAAARTKVAAAPALQHCECCSWKTRAELQTATLEAVKNTARVNERAATSMIRAGPSLQDREMAKEMESTCTGGSLQTPVEQTSNSLVSEVSLARLPVLRITKNKSKRSHGPDRRSHRQVERLSIKVRPLPPTKPKRTRTAIISSNRKGEARVLDVQAPVRISSRGRAQRPLKRHKNDLY